MIFCQMPLVGKTGFSFKNQTKIKKVIYYSIQIQMYLQKVFLTLKLLKL